MNRFKLVVLFIFISFPGYCYIDPGTGSIVLQAIIAGFLGLSFYFKSIFAYFKKVISKVTLRNGE